MTSPTDESAYLVNETFAAMSAEAVYESLIFDMIDSRMEELIANIEFPRAVTSDMLDLACDLAGFDYNARIYASDWLENVASDMVLDSI